MPAAQGVLKWPTARPTLATLVDEFSLPLPDAAVDRVLLVHALEMSDDPEGLLREVWRVLAPSGRVMAVIPNRRGVWTRTDNTPFGHGRPYSRSQITQLLRQTWFTPTAWGEALFMPPVAGGWFLRSAMAWERVGAALSLPFAGVHIVEATKQVYRAIPAHRERTRLIPALEPVLVPSSLQRDDRSRYHCKRSPGAHSRDPLADDDVAESTTSRLRLLIPRIEIVAGGNRRGDAFRARAMRPAAPSREALAATAFETARAAIDLRLRSGDERRQAIDADIVRDYRLRLGLRLKLRLRTMFAMFAGLMLVARLVGLAVALMVALRVVARHERLRLHRNEAGLLPEIRKALALVVAILRGHFVLGARLRLVLTKLLLGGGDQAEIMFGMLIVIFGGDRIAGRTRVARQLHILFRDVGCGAADLDVGSVGLEHPGHRVLAAPAAIISVLVVPVTHPLVLVLTVSHVLPLFQP